MLVLQLRRETQLVQAAYATNTALKKATCTSKAAYASNPAPKIDLSRAASKAAYAANSAKKKTAS